MLNILTWKVGTFAFGALLIGAGITIAVLKIDNSRLLSRVTTLQSDLATAKANQDNLKAAIDQQNEAIKENQRQQQQRITAMQAKLKDAEKARATAERKATKILNSPIKGNNLEDRIIDVDARLLESLG